MEELIQKLQSVHGLSAEQSMGILKTITGYIKEKFPMVEGMVDNLFQSGTTPSAPGTSPDQAQGEGTNSNDLMDKIKGFMPGAEEKIEEIAKGKLGDFFGGNKSE